MAIPDVRFRYAAKRVLDAAQTGYVALGKATGVIDFPVPLNSSMRKTGCKTIRHYYTSGVSCYLPVATLALHQGVRLREPVHVLDFGCGVGRQLLHFTRHFPKARFSACDIDHTSVAFIAKNYPGVEVKINRFSPPLPFDSESMDMIYSVSTFSHINPDQQAEWLRELFRVTKPGGHCFLTTEGWTAFGMLGQYFDLTKDEAVLRREGILYREYDFLAAEIEQQKKSPQTSNSVGIEGSYGTTVLTPDFIRAHWPASGFEVIDVVEGVIDTRQDLVVLRRVG